MMDSLNRWWPKLNISRGYSSMITRAIITILYGTWMEALLAVIIDRGEVTVLCTEVIVIINILQLVILWSLPFKFLCKERWTFIWVEYERHGYFGYNAVLWWRRWFINMCCNLLQCVGVDRFTSTVAGDDFILKEPLHCPLCLLDIVVTGSRYVVISIQALLPRKR